MRGDRRRSPPRDERRRLLMIASGVGVTPFISWLRELRAQGESRAQGTERDVSISGAPEFVAARRRELRRHTRRTRSDVFAGY